MNNEHGNGNMAESPLKLPRETNKDINTSPVKQQVNRNQIIGRPIEIIKGKYFMTLNNSSHFICIVRPQILIDAIKFPIKILIKQNLEYSRIKSDELLQ